MARPKYPSDEQEQFMVRMPPGMRARIKHRAETNNRSMNAEIVSLLEESLIDRALQEKEEFRIAVAERQRDAARSVEDRLSAIEDILRQINERQETTYYPPQGASNEDGEER